jgi:hypothetical protein
MAGCGTLTPVVSGSYKLYAAAANASSLQVAVIDSRSHSIDRKLEIGAPSSDWKHLYSVMSDSLVDVNPEDGAITRTLNLPRHYELPRATMSGVPGGLSQNGSQLVLQAWDRTASVPTATHLLVVDTTFGSKPVPVELQGWFDFDAISNDGNNLYLIQYIAPQLYHVRLYRVGLHQLDPAVIAEKGAPPNSTMAGVKLMSVPSPDGAWLFTLYARQNEGAFIHGLKMDGTPFAACIDLPGEGYSKSADAFRWSLAINPAGTTLYAANGGMGLVTEVHIGRDWPEPGRSSKMATARSAFNFFIQNVEAKELASNSSVVSPDGKTLITAGGTGIVWVDTASLLVRSSALEGWRVASLGMAPDGRTLYALSGDGEIAEVAVASASVGARFNPGAGYPIAIMRVAPA